MMQAVVLRGARSVEVVSLPEPEVVPGSVVVEIDRCGIGGSDLVAWASGEVPGPAWFGHEWVGRIVEIGDRVTGRYLGERVIGAVSPPCGVCRPCRAGLSEHCDLVLEMIVGVDPLASAHGAFAQRIRVDARRIISAPEALDDATATLTEPAAVAAHAVGRHPVRLGDIAVVIGAGTIGMMVAELVRASGAGRVVVIEPDPMRREIACDLGADAAFAPGGGAGRWLEARSDRLGADLVYDCAGTAEALTSTVSLVRRGGGVVIVGVQTGGQLPWSAKAHERELTVRASLGYNVGDVNRVLDLMADDRLRLGSMIDPEPVTLGELAAVLAEQEDAPAGRLKRLVAPNL